MFANLFWKCGLNQTEGAVLLALLERGSSSAAQLAKASSLKRPTVYAALDSLYASGLVFKERSRSRTIFRAMSPQNIPKLLERNAKAEFDSVREAATLLGEQCKNFAVKERLSFGGFELSTIESSKAVYTHLGEVLHRGDFSAIFNPQLIPKEQRETTVLEFLESAAEKRPHIREIAVSGPATNWYRKNIRNKNHLLREIRPKEAVFSDIILVGGEVVISNYQINSELALRIKEENLYRTLMTMFDMLWESLD